MSSSHAALIVDADSTGLESLVYGFQGAEWRITACPAAETASLLVKASGADIVVVASRTDHEKARTLIRQIRSKDGFRTLPILVLGPEELRSQFKEFGGVDLLPLPAFVRDVLTAGQLLVAAGANAEQKPGEEPCFTTDTTTITTLSLVRTMNGLARSGQLHLERRGRQGEILFHEGELTAAQVGQLQGMAAVQHVLIWNDGSLQLHLRAIARRGQLHQTAHAFLEEFDRFQRDFTHAIKDIGPPTSVYTQNEGRLLQSAGGVPAEVTPVVRLCDGQRTISDVIDESPFRVLDTVRILARLVDLGILVRRDPKPEASPGKASTLLEDFWATARIVGPPTPRPTHASTDGTPAPSHASPAPVVQASPMTDSTTSHEGGTHQEQNTATRRRQTLELVPSASLTPSGPETPPPVTQPFTPALPSTPPQPAAVVSSPSVPIAVTPKAPLGAQTSGTIELGEGARRSQPSVRVAPRRASVVLDLALVEAATAPASLPVSSPTSAVVPESTPSVVPDQAAPAETPSARSADVAQATPLPELAHERPTAAPISGALETKQEEPNPAASPVVAPKKDPGATRLAGEMQVAHSGRSGRAAGKAERSTSSFQIDPSLTAEAPVAPKEPQVHPSRGQPTVVAPSDNRHHSGSFSPIEKDFFAREADLYKDEAVEAFTDLEDKRAKQAAKSSGGKSNKRPRK